MQMYLSVHKMSYFGAETILKKILKEIKWYFLVTHQQTRHSVQEQEIYVSIQVACLVAD